MKEKKILSKEGILYISTLIDCYRSKLVSYKYSASNNVNLVLETVKEAMKVKEKENSILLHSDRGFQYSGLACGKIAAGEIEGFATETIKAIFKNPKIIQYLLKDLPITAQKEILKKSNEITLESQMIRDAISKVKIFKEKIEISYYPEYLKEILLSHYENRPIKPEIESNTEETIIKDMRIAVVDNGSKIIIGAGAPVINRQDDSLIRLVLKAYKWNKMLTSGQVKNSAEIAKQEHVHYSYLKKVLRLAYLSPRVTQSILNRTQPRDLTVGKLFECDMEDWTKQEQFLGIK
jgi:hypothetical protein